MNFTNIKIEIINKFLGLLMFFTSTSTFAQDVSRFQNVPLNTIHPEGWMKEYLVRQKNGLGGHPYVSGYPFNTKMWMENIHVPEGHPGMPWWPYEQTAYFIDGTLRSGYLLNDSTLLKIAKENIHYVLTHFDKHGILGNEQANDWSRVVFFRALMAEYEATKNHDILTKLTRHYLQQPRLFNKGRDLMNIEIILWLYGKTNDSRLLNLAEQSFLSNKDSKQGGEYNATDVVLEPHSKLMDELLSDQPPSGHGVSFIEQVKIPAILYLYTGKQKYLDASLNGFKKLQRDHILVDGVPSSVEQLSGKSVSMAHETCDIVDFCWSAGYMLMATKDAHWGDLIERAFFNAGMGAINKEFKGHQYYSAPNQPVAAVGTSRFNDNMSWGKMAHSRMCYRTGHDTECCTGNIERLMPAYAGRMWMVDPDNNAIIKTLYGPSTFKANIHNQNITIAEKTNYPFSGIIDLTISTSKKVPFSLLIRIPSWCKNPEVMVNGNPFRKMNIVKGFLNIEQSFKDGDQIHIRFPMKISVSKWKVDGNGIAIERGPLVYSLPVKAKVFDFPFIGCKDIADFPQQSMTPVSNWNYAISTKNIELIKNKLDSKYPWNLNSVPIKLKVNAKKVLNWKLDGTKHLETWPKVIKTAKVLETVELVPLGATYLRMTILPKLNKE